MLTAQQQLFVQALEELNLGQVKQLLADGLNPNFIDLEKGPVISIWSDGLFKWWEEVQDRTQISVTIFSKIDLLFPPIEQKLEQGIKEFSIPNSHQYPDLKVTGGRVLEVLQGRSTKNKFSPSQKEELPC